MFQVGGTDVLVHKYIGPGAATQGDTPSTPNYGTSNETQIQDLLFLENRDRKYDPDIYLLRGVYNLADIDFNLSQFGLFLQNDTIFMTFHINDTVEKIGRKIMSGDVIELPHLKDEHALNNLQFALKRFYVVEEVNRAAEGFSVTWYPHLYRAKCKPLVDSQEFKEILDAPAGDGNKTLRDVMSTYNKSMEINKAILAQAELDSPQSGYDTSQLFTIPLTPEGFVDYINAGDENITVDTSNPNIDASTVLDTPSKEVYVGYLTEDGIPPNGALYGFSASFPLGASEGQFHLRTDYFPNRLFRYDGRRWVKYEDNVRMSITNLGADETATTGLYPGKPIKKTQKSSFFNNTTTATISGSVVKEKQALSKVFKPKADN
jgi:hypothetical protein